MSAVSVTRKTTIAVMADEISSILRAHFKTPPDAWVEFKIVDYGETLDRAVISWTVTDEIADISPPRGGRKQLLSSKEDIYVDGVL